ncbi:MAG: putative 4-hydroxybenzoate polyprenyltransferase [Syntrophobacteraceae bacterium]|jgi:4-hydroxybenzoate polyprenyltransferase|nr:putative 4-hydroxybenzoate polyprenyltransferase [Syntrophobacteraceae bacterium]
MLVRSVVTYGRLIKFSHTVFALPFALSALLLAHREAPIGWIKLIWIVLAMAGARSAAMGFNRLVDYDIDIKNPRTASRPLTSGEIDRRSVLALILISSGAFIFCAAMLGKLCLILSVPVLGVLFVYSYTKRFTSFCHLVLGFGIGLAPLGAWVAVSGGIDPRILLLSGALMTYIAGFDILYACQDVDFDRQEDLFSLPSRWGIRAALTVSALLHVVTAGLLFLTWIAFSLGTIYLVSVGIIAALLALEHILVRPGHLDKINIAFFHVNSVISILLLAAVWMDLWIGS